MIARTNWDGHKAGIRMLLCGLAMILLTWGCHDASQDAQLEALEGKWEITELTATSRGDLTEALRLRYDETPTLTFENSEPPRYRLQARPASASQPLVNVTGGVDVVDSSQMVFVSGFDTDIFWAFDFQTGTRLTMQSGAGRLGPAPFLNALLPSFGWTEIHGATLHLERTPE